MVYTMSMQTGKAPQSKEEPKGSGWGELWKPSRSRKPPQTWTWTAASSYPWSGTPSSNHTPHTPYPTLNPICCSLCTQPPSLAYTISVAGCSGVISSDYNRLHISSCLHNSEEKLHRPKYAPRNACNPTFLAGSHSGCHSDLCYLALHAASSRTPSLLCSQSEVLWLTLGRSAKRWWVTPKSIYTWVLWCN